MFVSRSLLPLENDELTKEIRGMITKEDNQESDDYMEDWFQKVTTPQQYSIFQQILAPNPNVHWYLISQWTLRYNFQIWM